MWSVWPKKKKTRLRRQRQNSVIEREKGEMNPSLLQLEMNLSRQGCCNMKTSSKSPNARREHQTNQCSQFYPNVQSVYSGSISLICHGGVQLGRRLRNCVECGKRGNTTMAVIMVLLGVLLFRTQLVMARPNRTAAEGSTEIFTVSLNIY